MNSRRNTPTPAQKLFRMRQLLKAARRYVAMYFSEEIALSLDDKPELLERIDRELERP